MTTESPAPLPDPDPFRVSAGGVELAGERSGSGPPVVLLHGLTATRRYVLMGSRLLERRGAELISYDARAHGDSGAAPRPDAYEYPDLVADLEQTLDALEVERAVLAGSSMGAHAAVAFALRHPERVPALVLSTPAYEGAPYSDPEGLAMWDGLAAGLRRDGVDGFMRAYQPQITGRFADSIERLTRQRMERHTDLAALADALEVVPRSAAFDGIERLDRITAPTLVIGSRDEADPGHPLAVAEEYGRRIQAAEFLVEEPGRSPLAWRGSQVSRAIDGFLKRNLPERDRDRGWPPTNFQDL
jgi:3-oxoadipate enol-lactonase